jgi:hypothetical protein
MENNYRILVKICSKNDALPIGTASFFVAIFLQNFFAISHVLNATWYHFQLQLS